MTVTVTIPERMVYAFDGSPPHEADDRDKLAALTADMAERGWVGAPILADYATGQAITGSHRIRAAVRTDTPIPAVDVADLLDEYGDSDWAALIDRYGDVEEAERHLEYHLPPALLDHLGYDR